MDEIQFEKESRMDLETALAQVRANIQADCRILSAEATEFSEFGQLSVDVAVGEQQGYEEWDYLTADDQRVPVLMIRCYLDCDLQLYHEATPDQISDYWAQVAQMLTNHFFTKNPAYQQALQQ